MGYFCQLYADCSNSYLSSECNDVSPISSNSVESFESAKESFLPFPSIDCNVCQQIFHLNLVLCGHNDTLAAVQSLHREGDLAPLY